jgi:hypothetical protein
MILLFERFSLFVNRMAFWLERLSLTALSPRSQPTLRSYGGQDDGHGGRIIVMA